MKRWEEMTGYTQAELRSMEAVHLTPPDVVCIRMDPNQLEHLRINLAMNARDAMPYGGDLRVATMNITCDAEFARVHHGAQPGAYVAMAVSDTGHGMDAGTAAQAFEPFYTTKSRDQGTGPRCRR